jgi:hypothetical protein
MGGNLNAECKLKAVCNSQLLRSMTERRLPDAKTLLLELLHESYDKFAWHGPNLSQALRGVDARQASWRPPSTGTALWTIREIVLHVAGVMQRDGSSLLGTSREAPLRVVNEEEFPFAGVSSDEEWQRDVEFLRAAYELLRRAVSEATPARLEKRAPSRAYDREWTFLNVIYGVALHNVYHAAQIVSLRRQQGTWTEWQP